MKQLLIIFALFSLFVCSTQISQAQTKSRTDISGLKEHLSIITDRSVYTTDEVINFRANYSSPGNSEQKFLSSVLYIEVITADGLPILQHKYPLGFTGTNEQIQLPENIKSGQYFIKGYTKWMRNFSVAEYAYCPLTIVNPKNKKHSYQETICLEDAATKDLNTGPTLILNNTSFGKRDIVTVSFEQEAYYNTTPHTISVTRKGAKTGFDINGVAVEEKPFTDSTELLYPEINGMVLSGTVINTATKTGEQKISLHLTLMNGQPYFAATTSNENGRFYFTLPHLSSIKDFFITADSKDKNLSINLDAEYCQKPVKICINEKKEHQNNDIAEQIMINAQLNSRFAQKDTLIDKHQKSELSFYGSPTRIILTQKYIDLPYIEEFISELIPEFLVIHRKGEAFVKTKKQNTFSPFPVLLLIDDTPVYDKDIFLKTRTNKIERIEIVDKPYIIGGLKYNGIINAKTAKHNFAGIDLPDNSMFFSYQFYTKDKHNQVTKAISDTRIPDRRNCLYWNPEFYVDNGTGEFTFTTSDVPGNYEVILQYPNLKNEIVTITKMFEVK